MNAVQQHADRFAAAFVSRERARVLFLQRQSQAAERRAEAILAAHELGILKTSRALSEMAIAMNVNEWRAECNYISRVTMLRGNVSEMNHSKETFLRYCEQQRDLARREGRDDAALYIQECIDDLNGGKKETGQ